MLVFEKATLFSLLLSVVILSLYFVMAVIFSSSFCWLRVYVAVCFSGLLMYGFSDLPLVCTFTTVPVPDRTAFAAVREFGRACFEAQVDYCLPRMLQTESIHFIGYLLART